MARICKVLIVEDNDTVRELLGDVLRAEGFHFSAVETGAGMREALAAEDFEIVVIDLLLPGGEDGFALAEAARERGCGVILTTGDHRQLERIAASGHRYLLKPFAIRELVDRADEILRETRATCERLQGNPQSPAPVAV